MLNIVLVEPEIPQNCGNIARTCAATGCNLHLIRPLGFDISEKAVKRAGLDYWNLVNVQDYENLEDFFAKNDVKQMWCLSTKAPRCYTEARFEDGCYLFFGKETKGLPEDFLDQHFDECVRIPLRGGSQPEFKQCGGHHRVRGPAAVGFPRLTRFWKDEAVTPEIATSLRSSQ